MDNIIQMEEERWAIRAKDCHSKLMKNSMEEFVFTEGK